MKNFIRALKFGLHYRFLLLSAMTCSILVAALWGGNIGTVYPFVEVIFENKSLGDWVNSRIQETEKDIRLLSSEINHQDEKVTNLISKKPGKYNEEVTSNQTKIRDDRSQLESKQKTLKRLLWVQMNVADYLPTSPFQSLVFVIVVLLIGTFLKDIILVMNVILVERVTQLAIFDIRKEFFRRTLRLDLADFDEEGSSDLMSRFTFDMECLGRGLNALFGRAFREPLKMIVCLSGAAWISWRLLLLSLVLAPLAVLLIRKLSQSLKRANRRAMQEMSEHYSLLSETFSGIQTVKAFATEPQERNRFHLSAKHYFQKAMRIVFYNSLTKPTTELLGICVICLALLSGAYLVLFEQTHLFGIRICDQPLTRSMLIWFYALLAGVSDPLRKLAEIYNEIQRSVAAADRIFEKLDREPTVSDPTNARPIPRPHRELTFDKVSFHYSPGTTVLEEISLRITQGETLAIVGPNGCGKSTLAKLVPRFYDPTSGSVRLDQIDLRDFRSRDLRSQIGLVTQQTFLFDDTVLANIRYGSPEASDEQVVEAAKKAHAHKFIESKLENGYQTKVGQGGGRLSGGQRQRIALARVILRDPKILILDEATSQVDLESEQLIHKVLEQFIQDRTAIIITHRLSTLNLADRILVMEAGRQVDLGSHEELSQRCDLYQRLHQIQFQKSA